MAFQGAVAAYRESAHQGGGGKKLRAETDDGHGVPFQQRQESGADNGGTEEVGETGGKGIKRKHQIAYGVRKMPPRTDQLVGMVLVHNCGS